MSEKNAFISLEIGDIFLDKADVSFGYFMKTAPEKETILNAVCLSSGEKKGQLFHFMGNAVVEKQSGNLILQSTTNL